MKIDYTGKIINRCKFFEPRGTDDQGRTLWLYCCQRCGKIGIRRVDNIKKQSCNCKRDIAYKQPGLRKEFNYAKY